MENKTKHLEIIQGVIARMDNNSFLIKGWSMTLVSALFALAASGSNKDYVLISYFVLPIFWMLDGFYLHQERCFRALFDAVRAGAETSIDFNMDTKIYNSGRNAWLQSLFSKVLLIFYGATLLATLIVMFLVT